MSQDTAHDLYRVIGPYAVFGHAPGSEFQANIPAGQADRLVSAGHLKRVTAPAKPKRGKE